MPFSAQLAMSVSFLQLEILTEAPIETIYSSPVAVLHDVPTFFI